MGYRQLLDDEEYKVTTEDQNSSINYGPATEQEKKETEEFKKNTGQQEDEPKKDPSTNLKQVTPVITGYGQTSVGVEVGSRVPGIIESNGICTLTLKKDDKKVTEKRAATPDASETSCGYISISRDRLSKGEWVASVTYTSKKSKGTSATERIQVK